MEKNKKRDSRLEFIRIVATLMILFHHIIQHSGQDLNSLIKSPVSTNQFISVILGSWGQLGVTIFVILTSWFLTDIRVNVTREKPLESGLEIPRAYIFLGGGTL